MSEKCLNLKNYLQFFFLFIYINLFVWSFFLKVELESSIINLNLQIKNLERLSATKDSNFLRKMLISRKRGFRNLLVKYKKYIMKEQLVLK